MIIFLYGPDTYRSQQKLNEIIEHYQKVHKSGLNLRYFDGDSEKSLNFQDFRNEIETASMFREKKLLVLKDIFSNKDFQEEFLKQREKFVNSGNIILIYERKQADKKSPFFKFLKKNSESQEFEPLEGPKLSSWIKKEFKQYNSKTDSEALAKLIEYVGNDLWRMSNEIRKLASYKKEIGIKEIELLVRSKIETDIFKTIDAIAQKNKKQALILLHKHLEKGDSPLYLLSMINYQFRNLLVIKDLIEKHNPYNLILKKSGLHPFVVKKSYYQSQKFTLQELKKIYQKIFQADLDIKTGKVEPETALDLLIAEI